jgi:hypothetical protein
MDGAHIFVTCFTGEERGGVDGALNCRARFLQHGTSSSLQQFSPEIVPGILLDRIIVFLAPCGIRGPKKPVERQRVVEATILLNRFIFYQLAYQPIRLV